MSKLFILGRLMLTLYGLVVTGFGILAALILETWWGVWLGLGMVGVGVPSWLAGAARAGAAAHQDAKAVANRRLNDRVRRGRP